MDRNEPSHVDRHLTPDEIELCALEAPESEVAGRLGAHVRGCPACRREVAALAALDRQLGTLPLLGTSAGFTERVMARVTLPVPWYEVAREAVRRRWVALSVGLAAACGTVGGMAYWLFGLQGLTPGGLATLAYEGLRTLLLQALIILGRAVYDLGLVDLAAEAVERFTLPEAATAMALMSLLALAALWAMRKVMMEAGGPAHRVAGR